MNDRINASDEIMTLREIAGYLKVSEKTVLRMARAGDIPGAKISGQWRFHRGVLDMWLASKMEAAPDDSLLNILKTKRQSIDRIPQLVNSNRLVLNMPPAGKHEILLSLVKAAENEGLLEDPGSFLQLVLEREEVVSTAIGGGIAVPHTHVHENSGIREPFIVIGVCPEGTDFESLDGAPTYVFFLLGAIDVAQHLKLMAKMVLLCRNTMFIERIRISSSSNEVMHVLIDADIDMSIRLASQGKVKS